ncbi:MAG: ATP-binding protein [Pedobacter sp.]
MKKIEKGNDNDANSIVKQIRADDHYYRSIIENNSFYVIKTDLEGKYTYMNPFFCQKFGLEPAELLGTPSLDLIIEEDHQACIDTVQQCFINPGQSHWVILRKPHSTGILSTQWEFRTVPDESGNSFELLCIGHNITSLIMRQQELQTLVNVTADQNKKLINFTYIISHNIRSHVANIIGIIDLNDDGNEQEKDMSWDIIKKSVSGLDATIRNLSDVINIQTNTNLLIKKIYVKDEIIRIIDSIRILFDKANAKISYHFEESIFLQTNPAYLESIVLNLLTNALKYKSPHRALEVDLNVIEQDGYNILIFKDNGVGINLETNGEEIFGMYKTFHGNADAKGLGLFIIKNQIEALGGMIEVESTLNESTTFKVFFPVDKSINA